MATVITIKKYPNRRLYNTVNSTYITVEDVSDLIKEGNRIEVFDVNTGDDITAQVLTQIIMNKAKEDNSILPVSLLHLVIQHGESHLHDFFDKYLETTIENYLGFRKQMDDQFKNYMDMSSFSEMAMKNLNTLNPFSNLMKDKKDED